MKKMLISLIKRYWYLRKLDTIVFPGEPIPIKIVWKGRKPAGYWNVQRRKSTKEWYEVSIIAIPSHEFEITVHEVRHRVQVHNPGMKLFTKEKLLEIQRKNPQQNTQELIEHLEAVEKKYQKSLPEIEEDAIIVTKLIEQKCRGLRDPLETASQWIKKTP